MVGSTLIYYQRVPTDGARRLGCAGILVLCCRLPASGLLRPEARWPDKVLFSAEKSGAAARQAPPGGVGMVLERLWCLWRKLLRGQWPAGRGWGARGWCGVMGSWGGGAGFCAQKNRPLWRKRAVFSSCVHPLPSEGGWGDLVSVSLISSGKQRQQRPGRQ